MSLNKEQLEALKAFDARVLQAYLASPRTKNADLARLFGVEYNAIARSLHRSGISRPIGRPKKTQNQNQE